MPKKGRMSKFKGWFMKPKPAPSPAMKPTVMAQPVTVQPVMAQPSRKLNPWEDPIFMNSVAKIKNGMPEPEPYVPVPYVPPSYMNPKTTQFSAAEFANEERRTLPN